MSSCQGELPENEFEVIATDQSGNVLVADSYSTLKNGFLELWLPRDRTIQLTIKGLDRQATGRITTFNSSKTCITTFQLS